MGKTRMLMGGCAAALLAGGLTVGMAPAASAADIDVTVPCSQAYAAEAQVIYAQPGDRIRITYGTDATGLCQGRAVFATTSESYEQVFESGFPNGRGEDIPTTPTYIWEIRSDVAGIVGGPDDWVINVDSGTGCGVDNNTGCGQDFYLVIGTSIAGSVGGATEAPAAWYQSYARLARTRSAQAGWSPSWDFWPNGGTGGWVCNRSVLVSGATP